MRTLISTVVLIALLGLVRYVGIPKQVRSAIEESGAKATGESVDVDNLRVRLLEGDVLFGPLEVEMAEGFESDYALKLDRVEVFADLATVFDPVVIVDSMRVIGVHVIIEQQGLKLSARDLITSLRRHVQADTTSGLRFTIRELRLSATRASVATLLGARDVAVPDITLRNVGTEAGEPLAALWRSILEPLLLEVASASAFGNLGSVD